MDFDVVSVASRPFLHVTRSATMAPGDIPRVMEDAFAVIGAFITNTGISPTGPPVAVYRDWDGQKMNIDVGFPVNPTDAARASGDVHAGKTPAGRALKSLHHGAYDALKDTYGAMETHIAESEETATGTAWEVYVTDPDNTPEADLVTEVYMQLG